MILIPGLQHRKERPYLAIRTRMAIPFGGSLSSLWTEVSTSLENRGITSPGPAMIRYLTTGLSNEFDIEVGFALDQAVSGDKRIIAGILPAGEYATLVYTGPYKGNGIYLATVALLDWARENRILWDTSIKGNLEWWRGRVEWYLTDPEREPDSSKFRTELAFLVK
jgi:effector-binding domain-containing protein